MERRRRPFRGGGRRIYTDQKHTNSDMKEKGRGHREDGEKKKGKETIKGPATPSVPRDISSSVLRQKCHSPSYTTPCVKWRGRFFLTHWSCGHSGDLPPPPGRLHLPLVLGLHGGQALAVLGHGRRPRHQARRPRRHRRARTGPRPARRAAESVRPVDGNRRWRRRLQGWRLRRRGRRRLRRDGRGGSRRVAGVCGTSAAAARRRRLHAVGGVVPSRRSTRRAGAGCASPSSSVLKPHFTGHVDRNDVLHLVHLSLSFLVVVDVVLATFSYYLFGPFSLSSTRRRLPPRTSHIFPITPRRPRPERGGLPSSFAISLHSFSSVCCVRCRFLLPPSFLLLLLSLLSPIGNFTLP